jgi:hypothetical protein
MAMAESKFQQVMKRLMDIFGEEEVTPFVAIMRLIFEFYKENESEAISNLMTTGGRRIALTLLSLPERNLEELDKINRDNPSLFRFRPSYLIDCVVARKIFKETEEGETLIFRINPWTGEIYAILPLSELLKIRAIDKFLVYLKELGFKIKT